MSTTSKEEKYQEKSGYQHGMLQKIKRQILDEKKFEKWAQDRKLNRHKQKDNNKNWLNWKYIMD